MIGFADEWILALRKRKDKLLFEEPDKPKRKFQIIHNSFRYWCADPFLFSYKGRDFIFFEMFDRLKAKGCIGYREIKADESFSHIKVAIDYKCHLSFPFIYEKDGKIYLVPESSNANSLKRFVAKTFPDEWETDTEIINQKKLCDTVFFEDAGQEYMLTQEFDQKYVFDSLYLYKHDRDQWIPCGIQPVIHDIHTARNAGALFITNNSLIRPSQNCGISYGKALCFNKVEHVSENGYLEHKIIEISCDSITLNAKNKYDGIHTYNVNEKYEIIDLKYSNHCHILNAISRLYYAAQKILKMLYTQTSVKRIINK